MAPSVLIHHMHDHVDGSSALLLDIAQRDGSSRASHGKLCQAAECICGAIGMNGRKRSAMACIQGIQEDACLRAAYFSDDDSVWPMAKRRFEKVSETDLALMGVELGFGGDNMRLLNIELGDIFQDQNGSLSGIKEDNLPLLSVSI